MIKPDELWNFFLSAPDGDTIGRVCLALADRREELETPLNKFEESYVKLIVQSAEWYDEATDHIAKRKRKNYLIEKKNTKGLNEYEQTELDSLVETLNYKPSLAKKAGLSKLSSAKSAKTAKSDSSAKSAKVAKATFADIHPSVRPSVRPSIHPSNTNRNILTTPPPLPPEATRGGREETVEDDAIRNKSSDEFKHISREELHIYFARMRTNGVKSASEEVEERFWTYLVSMDFKKADGFPISKQNVNSTYTRWHENRDRDERDRAERREAEATARKAEEDVERERKERAEKRAALTLALESDE